MRTFAARDWYAVLALGSAGFTLFGSLVPFAFRGRPWDDAVGAFVAAMSGRIAIESRSDAVANVMLGVPLGFALLGMLWADRAVKLTKVAASGLALLPACAAFSAAVEFAQLYVPVRTCSGSDVLAQTVGAAFGMTGWLVCGQRLTEEVRKATHGTGAAGRFLIAYVLLLGFIQALPLDLTLSPRNVYHKFKDGKVQLIPFGEFWNEAGQKRDGEPNSWDRIGGLIKLAGLYLPAGLLAGCLPGRFWSGANPVALVGAALTLPAVIEAGQLLVESRVSSATDATVGALALLAGWRLARQSLSRAGMVLAGLVWLAGMMVVSWQPLEFPGPAQAFDWVPGFPLEGGNPLSALEEMLTKLVLFGLLGVIVAAYRGVPVVLGVATSALFEAVQVLTPNHTPCITDVLLGGMGAFAGAWVRRCLEVKVSYSESKVHQVIC